MQGTSNRTNAASDGLQNTRAETISLEPWDIAEKCLPIGNGQRVSIEFATDAQFQEWIAAQGVPVDEQGIVGWSFDDRCGVIMYALEHGIVLHFAGETIPNNSEKEFVQELIEDGKAAQEGA